jgi:hypothetical protein
MTLPVLAVSFGLYISGIAAILYFRPRLMFRRGGSWKEFGIGRGEDHTVIPFWLFAIFWAFISYGLSLVIMSHFATIAIQSFPEHSTQPQLIMPQPQPQQPQLQSPQMQVPPSQLPSQPAQAQPSFMKPVSSMIGLDNNQPGYYVLQHTPHNNPQYIYYGTTPPAMMR